MFKGTFCPNPLHDLRKPQSGSILPESSWPAWTGLQLNIFSFYVVVQSGITYSSALTQLEMMSFPTYLDGLSFFWSFWLVLETFTRFFNEGFFKAVLIIKSFLILFYYYKIVIFSQYNVEACRITRTLHLQPHCLTSTSHLQWHGSIHWI